MYDLVDDGNALYLVKKRKGEVHFSVVATFNGEPCETRDAALEMCNVLNGNLDADVANDVVGTGYVP